MPKTTSNTPSASAGEALSRQKKQARREAKLMLEIEQANKDLKKAQKKQSKAQARLAKRSAYVHTLETRLEELRAPSLEPALEMPQDSAELERQQVLSEPEGSIAHSDEYQQASPETEVSTLTGEGQHDPVVEKTTPPEAKVTTNAVTEGSEGAPESLPTLTTHRKAPAQRTAATRKPTATKRPTSSSTVPKRSANRSQSTGQPHADVE